MLKKSTGAMSWTVIRDYNRTALLSAVGLVIISYLLYGCYESTWPALLWAQTGKTAGHAGVVRLLRL
ncbi:Inner membrane protein YbhQ [Salmonella bongori]|nr:Inner membrane protein YbhQ [Salmonella bongori]